MGFVVTSAGYKPTKNALDAIANFPVPASLTDIRSWFSLVEQVSYAFAKSEVMSPFRELLRKNKKFYWDDQLTEIFKKARIQVTELVRQGVTLFELGRETMLLTGEVLPVLIGGILLHHWPVGPLDGCLFWSGGSWGGCYHRVCHGGVVVRLGR